MRYYKSHTIVLSEDNVTQPKLVRFSQVDQEQIDSASLNDGRGETVLIAAGVTDYEIPMGQIATGRWFFLRSEKDPTETVTYFPDFLLKINNSADFSIKGSRDCEMWATFASLKISNPGTKAIRLSYGIAGD